MHGASNIELVSTKLRTLKSSVSDMRKIKSGGFQPHIFYLSAPHSINSLSLSLIAGRS